MEGTRKSKRERTKTPKLLDLEAERKGKKKKSSNAEEENDDDDHDDDDDDHDNVCGIQPTSNKIEHLKIFKNDDNDSDSDEYDYDDDDEKPTLRGELRVGDVVVFFDGPVAGDMSKIKWARVTSIKKKSRSSAFRNGWSADVSINHTFPYFVYWGGDRTIVIRRRKTMLPTK